jgi:hypothetical protein
MNIVIGYFAFVLAAMPAGVLFDWWYWGEMK